MTDYVGKRNDDWRRGASIGLSGAEKERGYAIGCNALSKRDKTCEPAHKTHEYHTRIQLWAIDTCENALDTDWHKTRVLTLHNQNT